MRIDNFLLQVGSVSESITILILNACLFIFAVLFLTKGKSPGRVHGVSCLIDKWDSTVK